MPRTASTKKATRKTTAAAKRTPAKTAKKVAAKRGRPRKVTTAPAAE